MVHPTASAREIPILEEEEKPDQSQPFKELDPVAKERGKGDKRAGG